MIPSSHYKLTIGLFLSFQFLTLLLSTSQVSSLFMFHLEFWGWHDYPRPSSTSSATFKWCIMGKTAITMLIMTQAMMMVWCVVIWLRLNNVACAGNYYTDRGKRQMSKVGIGGRGGGERKEGTGEVSPIFYNNAGNFIIHFYVFPHVCCVPCLFRHPSSAP